jgi:sodium/hydrogen antiporter
MTIPLWSLIIGILLIAMVLAGTLLPRLLMSNAMIYLGVGYLLGPGGVGVIDPDPFQHAEWLERITEVVLLISLFTVGLKMGGVPLFDRRWLLPLRLAFVSMAVTVVLIAAVSVWGLGLSLGAAVLLGGILAPTDPVLASGVQTESGEAPDQLRFSLSGEGGMNDGTAFPFVVLGLGLLGGQDFGAGLWRWWMQDVLWVTAGGLFVGAALGALIGKLVVYLRTRHRQAMGLDEFLTLGLVGVSYGVAQLCLASGFLSVFAAGLMLQRVKEQPLAGTASRDGNGALPKQSYGERAPHAHHAGATMKHAVLGFNEQLEKLGEVTAVLLAGALLPYVEFSLTLLWFVPLLLIVLRPMAVLVGTFGEPMPGHQRPMICWFGIRGIGSLFYLMYALHHGVGWPLTPQLITLTLVTIAVSVGVHGVSVKPLMNWYVRDKPPVD